MVEVMTWKDLDRAKVVLEEVECDDYGDPDWHWHAKWYLDGKPLWSDYFRELPDEIVLYNTLVEAVRGGAIEIKERSGGE